MKVVVVQNKVHKHINDTLESINMMLEQQDLTRCDFIVFPEMFMTPYEFHYINEYKQTEDSQVINFLKQVAIKYHSYVIGGSIPFDLNHSIYNSSFILNREGVVIHRYDKIHLFEITYPNGSYYSEKEIFKEGSNLGVFDTEFGKIGIMICFDIRFPELADKLMKKGVKAIFVPAAFNTFTGPLHWQTTFRARAIDNQLFVIGCSPSADSYGSYQVYGHSIITNPYGTVLEELTENSGIIIQDLELKVNEEARNKIPIIKNKKL